MTGFFFLKPVIKQAHKSDSLEADFRAIRMQMLRWKMHSLMDTCSHSLSVPVHSVLDGGTLAIKHKNTCLLSQPS